VTAVLVNRVGPVDADECAREVIEVVPLGIRWLRAAIRSQEPSWSVPQLQALGFLQQNPGASLSELAAQLGVGLPSASALVSRLVVAGQVDRQDDPAERRRALLTLTPQGEAEFAAAIEAGRAELSDRLRALPAKDLTRVTQALSVLREVFGDA
jgi:DNA-binding MarR family transcriptional regulator